MTDIPRFRPPSLVRQGPRLPEPAATRKESEPSGVTTETAVPSSMRAEPPLAPSLVGKAGVPTPAAAPAIRLSPQMLVAGMARTKALLDSVLEPAVFASTVPETRAITARRIEFVLSLIHI